MTPPRTRTPCQYIAPLPETLPFARNTGAARSFLGLYSIYACGVKGYSRTDVRELKEACGLGEHSAYLEMDISGDVCPPCYFTIGRFQTYPFVWLSCMELDVHVVVIDDAPCISMVRDHLSAFCRYPRYYCHAAYFVLVIVHGLKENNAHFLFAVGRTKNSGALLSALLYYFLSISPTDFTPGLYYERLIVPRGF